MPTQWSEAEQVPLGCIVPHTAQRCHFSFHASGGLFSFSSERKEEKKRRQKLRFWISLRGFTWFLFCLLLPRERCAMQISSKYCIVSASLFAAAFALKCKAVQFYIWCVGAGFYAVERSGTSALGVPRPPFDRRTPCDRPLKHRAAVSFFFSCLRRPLFFQQRKKRGKETPPKTTFLNFLARLHTA